MSKEKFYTFDDWLKGKLPPPSEDPDLFRRADDYGGVKHIKSLFYNRKIKQEEVEKINDAKRETFHKSVEINSNLLFRIHKARAEKSRDKEQYIQSIVSEVDEKITPKKLRKINTGDTDLRGILAKDYLRLREKKNFDHEVPEKWIKKEIEWDDRSTLIYFNEFQMRTYMYKVAEKLNNIIQSVKCNKIENPGNSVSKENELSKIEKVQLIEEIYNTEDVKTYDEAIKIASKRAGHYMYGSYASFNSARNDVKDYL